MISLGLFYLLLLFLSSHAQPPPTCPEFPIQNTTTPQDIANTCYYFLNCHLVTGTRWNISYHFYMPSLEKYSPDQWLWDSCAHQITWSHRNVTNSMLDFQSIFSMQQPDGFVPEEIFWSEASGETDLLRELSWGNSKFASISQMPVLPFSLRAIWNASHDIAFLRNFVPKVVAYFDWWAKTRTFISGSPLIFILHGWESGLDASPAYDKAYGVTTTNPGYWDLYPQFNELTFYYTAEFHWNITKISQTIPPPIMGPLWNFFQVRDVGVNSVYAAGWRVLSELALIIGDIQTSTKCKNMQLQVETAIIKELWNPNLGRFINQYRDPATGQVLSTDVEVVQSLFPILLQTLPADILDQLINNQLLNTSKFWLTYPVPSVSADQPQFTPAFTVDLMWRGPTWPILNWFIMEGLHYHGYDNIVNQLMQKWIQLYQKSGVWEQYNPITGEAYGAVGLGMSTLIVDWMYRLGIVQ